MVDVPIVLDVSDGLIKAWTDSITIVLATNAKRAVVDMKVIISLLFVVSNIYPFVFCLFDKSTLCRFVSVLGTARRLEANNHGEKNFY